MFELSCVKPPGYQTGGVNSQLGSCENWTKRYLATQCATAVGRTISWIMETCLKVRVTTN